MVSLQSLVTMSTSTFALVVYQGTIELLLVHCYSCNNAQILVTLLKLKECTHNKS